MPAWWCAKSLLGDRSTGQRAISRCLVDDHLRRDVRQFTSLPRFQLSYRLEVSLHSVNTNRDAVDERERLRVLGEYGSEYACDDVSELWMP